MNGFRVGIGAFMLAALLAPVEAQLTLRECLDRAKVFSLKYRSAELALRASTLAREELEKTRLPQVKLESEVSYAPTSGTFGYDPAITDGGQLGGRVAVEQYIYDGGTRAIKSAQLGIEYHALESEKLRALRDMTYEVEQLFIEALRSQRAIDLQGESVRQLQEYLDLVLRLAKGGGASYTDVLKTQVQLQAAMRSKQKEQQELSAAICGLTELMGMPVDTAFSVAGSLEHLITQIDSSSADYLISQNLDVRLAELAMLKSKFETELAKSESLPAISAFADAGVLTSIDNLRLSAPDRAGVYGYMVGVAIEVPILNWGGTGLRIQQRQLATEGLMLQVNEIQRSVNTGYRKTSLQLKRAEERLQSTRASLKSAEENFALTKAKYASGGVLSMEVLSAQQMLTDLRVEELGTEADIQFFLARIKQISSR